MTAVNWPRPAAVASPTITTEPAVEPAVEMVVVQWLVNSSDPSYEGGGNIGGRRYTGQIGERAEIPASAAGILRAVGHVKAVEAEAEQAR